MDEAALIGEDDRLHSVAQFQLEEYTGHMRLDSRRFDIEFGGDLGVRTPTCEQPADVVFPGGQSSEPAIVDERPRVLFDQSTGARRRK